MLKKKFPINYNNNDINLNYFNLLISLKKNGSIHRCIAFSSIFISLKYIAKDNFEKLFFYICKQYDG